MADQQLTSLVEQMTLEEKIAQLIQLAVPFSKELKNRGKLLDRWSRWALPMRS